MRVGMRRRRVRGRAGRSTLPSDNYVVTRSRPYLAKPRAARCAAPTSRQLDGGDSIRSLGDMSSYRHIVIFQFKADAPGEKVRGVVEAFKALPGKLPAIKAFEWGTNVSPEGLDQGFTHIFTLTFASKEALEKQYLHEPAHQEFVALLPDILEKVLVLDYVGQ